MVLLLIAFCGFAGGFLIVAGCVALRWFLKLAFGLPVALGFAPWLVIWWILLRTVWKVRE